MTEHAIIKIRQLLESDSRVRQLERQFNSNRNYSNFFELRRAKLRVGEDIETPDDIQKMFLTEVTGLLSGKKKTQRDYIIGKYKKGSIEVINNPKSSGGAVRALFGDKIIKSLNGLLHGSDGVVHAMVHNSTALGSAPGVNVSAEYGWQKTRNGLSSSRQGLAFIDWEDPEALLKEIIRIGEVELPRLKQRYQAGERWS